MVAHGSYSQDSDGAARADFVQLVERHHAALYRFALSLTRTEDDACDLVQETFHIWATKGYQLQDPGRARAWLFTTLHRLFLETRRRQSRFPHHELGEVEAELPAVDSSVVQQLDGAAIVQLLQRVDEPFQAPVALFYLEDYSYSEIAEILHIPLGTVKSRIARGLSQLKQHLRADAAARGSGPFTP